MCGLSRQACRNSGTKNEKEEEIRLEMADPACSLANRTELKVLLKTLIVDLVGPQGVQIVKSINRYVLSAILCTKVNGSDFRLYV